MSCPEITVFLIAIALTLVAGFTLIGIHLSDIDVKLFDLKYDLKRIIYFLENNKK